MVAKVISELRSVSGLKIFPQPDLLVGVFDLQPKIE